MSRIRRFKVNINNYEAEEIEEEFKNLPGIRHNGQHYQLPGFALVEVLPHRNGNPGPIFKLFHPDTKPQTGEVDIYYYPFRWDGGEGVEFFPYPQLLILNRDSLLRGTHKAWPTGTLNLLSVVERVEEKLAKEGGEQRLKTTLLKADLGF